MLNVIEVNIAVRADQGYYLCGGKAMVWVTEIAAIVPRMLKCSLTQPDRPFSEIWFKNGRELLVYANMSEMFVALADALLVR